jgi:hypothetical protein
MNEYYATFHENRTVSARISQFLRGTVAVLLVGGVMYAAALVAHRQERVVPAPVAPVSAQQ